MTKSDHRRSRAARSKWTAFGLLLALAAMVWGAPVPLRAQQPEPKDRRKYLDDIYKEYDNEPRKTLPHANLPENLRNAIEQKQLLEEKPKGPIRRVKTTPMLGPDGQQLVGVVEDRRMTKPQLELRANLFLRNAPSLGDPQKAEDRRVLTESRILDDWMKSTILAVHAQRKGYRVKPEEIDAAYKQLVAQSHGNPDQATQMMRMIGIPEADLRQEIEDGIAVDKLMLDYVQANFPEQQKQAIFKEDPSIFLDPPRVRAWQLFYPLTSYLTSSQLEKVTALMNDLRKRLRKCKDMNDYLALKKYLQDNNREVVLSELSWATADEPLPQPVMKALFTMEIGETSDPVVNRGFGIHVVKVLERKEGEKSYEQAKPRIENFLIEKSKEILYEEVKGKYKIKINASGLTESHDVPEPVARAVASSPAGPGSLPEDPSQIRVPSVESVLKKKEAERAQQLLNDKTTPTPTPAAAPAPPAPATPPAAAPGAPAASPGK
ncbi:MAG: peptidyl-prolyl cis-trans isomerase [bacterium]|nr:peptidyl-prolyl cis-trans isomerase [bacterium]